MRTLALLLVIGAGLGLGGGCQLLDSDDSEPPPVCAGGGDRALVPVQELRDPWSGVCSSGGVDPCQITPAGSYAQPDPRWGFCSSACQDLDEPACLSADGCQAIYGSPAGFVACWSTAQDGPVRGGDCSAIRDAFECSRHDDCIKVHGYDASTGTIGSFVNCDPEPATSGPGCYGDTDCSPGDHCNADEVCLPPPGCDPTSGMACPPVCYGYCQPGNQGGACSTTADCPPEDDCVTTSCAPGCDPGAPGCCSRTCVPQDMTAPACSTLDEAACIDRTDGCHDWTPPGGCGDSCTPLYTGEGCDCDLGSCSCSSWEFQSCR
jgi:hypothetical protein